MRPECAVRGRHCVKTVQHVLMGLLGRAEEFCSGHLVVNITKIRIPTGEQLMDHIHGPCRATFAGHRDHHVAIAPLDSLLKLALYLRKNCARGFLIWYLIHGVALNGGRSSCREDAISLC